MANSKLIDILTGLSLTPTLCLDAGDENSYTSPDTEWRDVSGNGYDFFFGSTGGADANDPTFVDSAERRARMVFDGTADRFDYDTTNETFMKNMHKDNAKFTAIAWVRLSASGIFRYIFGDSATTTGVSWGAGSTNPANMQYRVLNAAAQVLTVSSGSVQIPIGSWVMVAIAIDESVGSNGLLLYRRDPTTRQTATATSTYSSPSSGDPTTTFAIGSRGGANNFWVKDIAMLAIFDATVLTATNFDDIYTATVERFYPTTTADVGLFTLTGVAATFNMTLSMLADVTSFVLTGIAASLVRGKVLAADAASFVFTGVSTVVNVAYNLAAGTANFVMTGIATKFANVMSAGTAAFTMTGISAVVTRGVRMTADAGSFVLTGIAAVLHGSFTMVAETGSFIVYGPIVSLPARFTATVRRIAAKPLPRVVDASLRKVRTIASKLSKI